MTTSTRTRNGIPDTATGLDAPSLETTDPADPYDDWNYVVPEDAPHTWAYPAS